MENEELKKLIQRIEEGNAEQTAFVKKQYRMARISTICSIAVLCIVLVSAVILVPRFYSLYNNLSITGKNLQTITDQLAATDLKGMIGNVSDLAETSQKDLGTAMEKINAIDIKTLNESIKALHDAVSPVADFFNQFKR
jgi:hypothetical protein